MLPIHVVIRDQVVVSMSPILIQYINALDDQRIDAVRKRHLDGVIQRLNELYAQHKQLNLVFICTHNSRRSILAQTWAFIAARFFDKPNISVYSGGTEQTAVYPGIISSLQEAGLDIFTHGQEPNKSYSVKLEDQVLELSSKRYDSNINPKNNFVALMTCSDADQNCPFIPAAIARISLTFEDPKFSDGTEAEYQVYFNKSMEIANELFYIFSLLTHEKKA